MKVTLNVTIELDPDAWTLNYGIQGNGPIREDIKDHSRNILEQTLSNSLGSPVTVTLR